MAQTIPVSQLTQAIGAVLAPAGTLTNLSGLILTQNTSVPIGSIAKFAGIADVGNYFGLSSPEYAAAQVYFKAPNNAQKAPASLYFMQYPSAAVSGYLRGGNTGLSLTQLQALSGTLTISFAGTPLTSSSINLSAATSFSNAATIIQAGFTAPTFTVSYNAQFGAFVFTSIATGASATITYATGTLASGLKLDSSANGAVLSQGVVATTPSAAMANAQTLSQEWYAFTTMWEPVTADKTSFSLWVNGQSGQYIYAGYDSDANAKVSNTTTTWGYAVQSAKYDGSFVLFGGISHAMFVLGFIASIDFTAVNGRATIAGKGQDGLLASVNNGTDAQVLLANGYNFYGVYGTGSAQFLQMQNGAISGKYLWLDSYINQIWLRTNLQIANATLLQNAKSIPYDTDGYAMIDAAMQDPIQSAITFGAIRKGVTLSASQIAQINQAVGKNVAGAVSSEGYYLNIADASAATRVARQSPPISLFYADGQSVQQINLTATDVL